MVPTNSELWIVIALLTTGIEPNPGPPVTCTFMSKLKNDHLSFGCLNALSAIKHASLLLELISNCRPET